MTLLEALRKKAQQAYQSAGKAVEYVTPKISGALDQTRNTIRTAIDKPLPQSVQRVVNNPVFTKTAQASHDFLSPYSQNVISTSSFGLVKPKFSSNPTSIAGKAGSMVGTAVGFANPINPLTKVGLFPKVGAAGSKLTQALLSRAAPKATGFVAKKALPAIGGELAETALYTGAATAAGAAGLRDKYELTPGNIGADFGTGLALRGIAGRIGGKAAQIPQKANMKGVNPEAFKLDPDDLSIMRNWSKLAKRDQPIDDMLNKDVARLVDRYFPGYRNNDNKDLIKLFERIEDINFGKRGSKAPLPTAMGFVGADGVDDTALDPIVQKMKDKVKLTKEEMLYASKKMTTEQINKVSAGFKPGERVKADTEAFYKLHPEMKAKQAATDAVPAELKAAWGEDAPTVPLRQNRPGSYTNVPQIDNPLMKRVNPGRVASEQKRMSNPVTAQSAKSFDDAVLSGSTKTGAADVKEKVGIMDYLRTPDRVLQKIGLGKEAELVRKKYDDYLDELPTQIGKITEWSKQVSKESNVRIFKYLDGQGVSLDNQEMKVANEIKTYLSEWADRLKLPKDNRISHYITHIFEPDFIKKEFDEDLAKIIQDKVAGSVYDPFLQERLGKRGYVEDTWRALDAYVKRATRKVHMDVALEPLKKKAENLEISQFNYVKQYVDRINLRPTNIDNMMDNTIKQVFGYKFGQRPTAAITKGVRQMVYRGTLGLNVNTALKNLTQGANTYAKLGEKYTLIGYTKALTHMFNSKELEDSGVLRNNFIEDRTLSATKQFWQKLDKGLFYLFETAEKINRGAAYYGAKSKALKMGMTEELAQKYAKDLVRDTQFTFGAVDTPVGMQSDLVKFFTQFQSYSVKQSEFLADMAKRKDYAGFLRWGLANVAIVYGVGKSLGIDYTDMLPFYGVLTGETKLGQTPAIQLASEVNKAVTGAPDRYGNIPDTGQRIKNVANAAIPVIPGGVQAKKTITGLTDVAKGYKETAGGNFKYPIKQTTGNYVKAGLLGTNRLSDANEANKEQKIYDALKGGSVPSLSDAAPKTSADAIYRYIMAQPKEERQAAYEKVKPTITPEIKEELKAIKAMDDEGLGRKDRDLSLIPEPMRARKIYERIMDLDKKNRQAKYEDLVKAGIITPTIKAELKRLQAEGK